LAFLPNQDPAINRWAILECPYGTSEMCVDKVVEDPTRSTQIATKIPPNACNDDVYKNEGSRPGLHASAPLGLTVLC